MAKIAVSMFRTTIACGVLSVLGLSANAQEGESERPPVEKVYDRSEDKIVLEITNDMWLNLPEGVDLRGFSPGVKVYLFSDYTFGESDVSFAWGLGVSVDNVHSNAEFIQDVAEDGTVGDQVLTPFTEGYEYDKNKFVTTFIELPLELRYIKTGRNPFKLAAGFRLGYMVSNHQKIIDTEGKRKYYDFDNMNRLRYGVSARLGIGMVQLTGFYSLVPLIEQGKGTEDITAVSLGLSFTFIK